MFKKIPVYPATLTEIERYLSTEGPTLITPLREILLSTKPDQ